VETSEYFLVEVIKNIELDLHLLILIIFELFN